MEHSNTPVWECTLCQQTWWEITNNVEWDPSSLAQVGSLYQEIVMNHIRQEG